MDKDTENLWFEKLALRVSEHGIKWTIFSNEIINVIECNIGPCWIICWFVFSFLKGWFNARKSSFYLPGISQLTLSWWISHPKSILWGRCKNKFEIITNSIHKMSHTLIMWETNTITTASMKSENTWATISWWNNFGTTTSVTSSWLIIASGWLFNSVTNAFPFLIFCLFKISYLAPFFSLVNSKKWV